MIRESVEVSHDGRFLWVSALLQIVTWLYVPTRDSRPQSWCVMREKLSKHRGSAARASILSIAVTAVTSWESVVTKHRTSV
jgi:hypothetical protein